MLSRGHLGGKLLVSSFVVWSDKGNRSTTADLHSKLEEILQAQLSNVIGNVL